MSEVHPDIAKHLQDELDATRAELRRCYRELIEHKGELAQLVAQRDTHWRLMEQAMRWLRDSPDTVKLSEQMAEEVVKAPPGFFDPPETLDV